MVDATRRQLLRCVRASTGIYDSRRHRRPDLVQPFRPDRRDRGDRPPDSAQMEPHGFLRAVVLADLQHGLLAGNHGNPGPGALRHPGLCRHRRTAGHRRGAQADVLYHAAACTRLNADGPHLRLPDPHPDPVRPGRGTRPDLHGGLRHRRPYPADLPGYLRRTTRTAGCG
ncbi:hypothetical protein D3C76_891180 [compost metagenome]